MAAAGTTMRLVVGQRIVTTSARAAGTSSWGFAFPGLLEIYLKVSFCFFTFLPFGWKNEQPQAWPGIVKRGGAKRSSETMKGQD